MKRSPRSLCDDQYCADLTGVMGKEEVTDIHTEKLGLGGPCLFLLRRVHRKQSSWTISTFTVHGTAERSWLISVGSHCIAAFSGCKRQRGEKALVGALAHKAL